MNVVVDEAEEVYLDKTKERRPLGACHCPALTTF